MPTPLALAAVSVPLEWYTLRIHLTHWLSDQDWSVRDKKYLYPLEPLDYQTLALTDRISQDQQLRFSLKERSVRHPIRLAKKLCAAGVTKLPILSQALSQPMVLALTQALVRYGVTPKIVAQLPEPFCPLTACESELVRALIAPNTASTEQWSAWLQALVHREAFSAAQQVAQALLRRRPQLVEKWALRLGQIQLSLGYPQKAEQFYQMVPQHSRQWAERCYALAMLYLRHYPGQQRHDQAKRLLEEGFAHLNGLANTYSANLTLFGKAFNRNGYALIAHREGNCETAIALLKEGEAYLLQMVEKAERVLMLTTVIYYNLGQCYLGMKEPALALAAFEHLLSLDPLFPEYHLAKAYCYGQLGERALQSHALEAALLLDPDSSEAHHQYSIFCRETDQEMLAVQHAQEAWKLSGSGEMAYHYAYLRDVVAPSGTSTESLAPLYPGFQSPWLPDWSLLAVEHDPSVDAQNLSQTLRDLSLLFPHHEAIQKNLIAQHAET